MLWHEETASGHPSQFIGRRCVPEETRNFLQLDPLCTHDVTETLEGPFLDGNVVRPREH
jgi:hypothetical protein